MKAAVDGLEDDLRFLGLLAFLCGDAGLCNRAWTHGRLDLASAAIEVGDLDYARDRIAEALVVMVGLVKMRPALPRYRQALLEMADRWWAAQGEPQRLALIRGALDWDSPLLRDLFIFRPNPTGPPRDPAPLLHEVTLDDLAQRMEVTDMDKLNVMRRWPHWLKAMQARAWSSTDRRSQRIWQVAVGAGALVVAGSATAGEPACPGAGTVAGESKISATAGGFDGPLDDGDLFGGSVAALGDLDGDTVPDLAVGVVLDDDGGINTGAVWLLELNDCGPTITQQPGGVLLPIGGGIVGINDFLDLLAAWGACP